MPLGRGGGRYLELGSQMVVSQLLGYQELNSGTFKSYIISPLHCRIIPLATVAISNAGLVTLTIFS